MIILGLTGSIGMGKSTTAQMLRDEGIPVHDADESVHKLYSGAAVPLIEAAFPGCTSGGIVDRQKLGAQVLNNPESLKKLEAIVHPLVTQARQAFLAQQRASGAKIVVLDVPLLFETGLQDQVDKVIVVTAPADVQRQRVLARPNMTIERFESILAKQLPDAQKRARADYCVDTSRGLESARQQIQDILKQITLS